MRRTVINTFVCVAALTAAAAIAVCWLATIGIPRSLYQDRLQFDRFSVDAKKITLRLDGGMTARDVHVTAAESASGSIRIPRVDADVDIVALLRRKISVTQVVVQGAELTGSFPRRPRQSADGGASAISLDLALQLQDCRLHGLRIPRLAARIVHDPEHGTRISEIEGVLGEADTDTHNIAGHVTIADGIVLTFSTQMDPNVLSGAFAAYGLVTVAQEIARLQFPAAAPACTVEGRISMHSPVARVQIQVDAPSCRYNDVPLHDLSGEVLWERDGGQSSLDISKLKARYAGTDRTLALDLAFDLDASTVSVSGRSTLPPDRLLHGVSPGLERIIADVTVHDVTEIQVHGTYGIHRPDATELNLQIRVERLTWLDHDIESAMLDVALCDEMVQVNRVSGVFYGGDLRGTASVRPLWEARDWRYRAAVSIRNTDFSRLPVILAQDNADEIGGRLHTSFDVQGDVYAGAIASLNGFGQVEVDEAKLFEIPILSGLTNLLSNTIPGYNQVMQGSGTVSAPFVLHEGKVIFEKNAIGLEGSVLSLRAEGYYALDGALDFTGRATLLNRDSVLGNIAQAITYPVGKLFEIRLLGTRDAPEWSLNTLPTGMLKKLGLRRKKITP